MLILADGKKSRSVAMMLGGGYGDGYLIPVQNPRIRLVMACFPSPLARRL